GSVTGTMTVTADHDVVSHAFPLPGGTYAPDVGTVSSTAPVFVNATAGDFRQTAGSVSTIDKGAAIGGLDPTSDLDGEPRSLGSAPDIGADELPGAPSVSGGAA